MTKCQKLNRRNLYLQESPVQRSLDFHRLYATTHHPDLC